MGHVSDVNAKQTSEDKSQDGANSLLLFLLGFFQWFAFFARVFVLFGDSKTICAIVSRRLLTTVQGLLLDWPYRTAYTRTYTPYITSPVVM